VQIANLSGRRRRRHPLDGRIDNVLGHTFIKNVRGNILSDNANDLDGIESTGVNPTTFEAIFRGGPGSDSDVELIRTNKLELDGGRRFDRPPDRTARADRGGGHPLP